MNNKFYGISTHFNQIVEEFSKIWLGKSGITNCYLDDGLSKLMIVVTSRHKRNLLDA